MKLLEMITDQPRAIAQTLALDLESAVARLSGARRVTLVGTGTSQHAAELGALMLASADVDARAQSCAQFVVAAHPVRDGDAVILISHTGKTAYARRARTLLGAREVPWVAVTGPDAGWPEAITTPVAEQAETYTISYLTALVVLARLAAALGAPDLSDSAISAAADAVRDVIVDPQLPDPALADAAIAVIGAGPWGITAREGALKLREASGARSEGFESERFLHGFAVPYGDGDHLVVLEPRADPDGLTAALARAAEREGMHVSVLAAGGPALSPLLAQLPATVRLQLLAAACAQHRGADADHVIRGAWDDTELWRLGGPTA